MPDIETIFEVAVIVLVRFRVNDDREINPRLIHALKQMLGRRRRVRTIGRAAMIRKSSIVFAGKTMNMGVHDRRAVGRFVRTQNETDSRQGQRET